MKFNATWAMAVGGMVGGGIFSVLGVIISTAGSWAWLSFITAGLIALISAHSYSQLCKKYHKGGGAFTFLREINHEGFAGALSWVLVIGYILTMAVYAFTFGHYVAHVIGAGIWLPRILAISSIAILTIVNLRGVGSSANVEIITVYGKLAVLLGLAIFGLVLWNPENLTSGIEPKPWTSAILGAATIFMAYEGFQLLSYDYEDLMNPDKTLPSATFWAVVTVIIIYLLVTVGTSMLVGAETLIEQKEVALSIAGKKALGQTGLILVTIAAAFSTGSAINATLFSTARMMESVAEKKDLPHIFVKENNQNIPFYAVLIIASLSGVLSFIGSLGNLVDSASIIFLFTFGVVNYIAFTQHIKLRWFSLFGAFACGIAIIGSVYEQIQNTPWSISILLIMCLIIFIFRPYILIWIRKRDSKS